MNTIHKFAARFILSVAAVTFTATASLSAPITIPAGLNPGDQYRLAFVTSTTRDALSSDIADYNAFVTAAANSQAALAALGTTWMAIASTTTVDARDNTGTNPSSTGFPIYLLDPASTKIADNNADLWDGSIYAALNVSETGSAPGGGTIGVWTGTEPMGTGLSQYELDGVLGAQLGLASTQDTRWIAVGTATSQSHLPYHIYGLSAVLTVTAVPEPGALGVLALGLVGLGLARRRKRTVLLPSADRSHNA